MTKGVLNWPDMRAAINLNTGFFETSQYTVGAQMRIIAGNWDGAGQSAGNLQYNWGPADRLTELYNHMLNNYDSVVQTVFGSHVSEYNTFRTVNLTYTRANKIAWSDTITDYGTPAGHALVEPWKTILGDLLSTPECIAKYLDMMDTYYVPNALDLFKQLSCTSRAALSSLFDLNVNRGRFYPCNTLVVDFDQIDANGALTADQKEAQKIAAINNRGNDPTNGMDASAATFAPRRDAQANQGGTYFGATYDPETQFDINQEPAITEKAGSFDVNLGESSVTNVFLGTSVIDRIYLGANLVGAGTITPYTTSKVPDSQFRTNSNSYSGFETGPITLSAGQKLWIDIQNFVACRTYYTIDGSTPTESSSLYHEFLTFDQSCTLKVLNKSVSGISETIRTLAITIPIAPTTTISPSTTTQNTIPFTVTLTTSEQGAAIKYKLGSSGTIYDYSAPFSVNQNSVGVDSTQITVKYWSVGASLTEAEKSITYNTAGATPAKPVPTATNGVNKVDLSWAATANTLSYSIFRSTASGTLGSALSQYQAGTTYSDTTAVAGTTYYYTVQAGNYGVSINSDQVTGVALNAGWKYVKITMYGDNNGNLFRVVEWEVWNQAQTTNLISLQAPFATTNAGFVQGKTTAVCTDGDKNTANRFAFMDNATTTPSTCTYNLGAFYLLSNFKMWNYSAVGDQRKMKFKVEVSKDNVSWTMAADYSTNTTVMNNTDGFFPNAITFPSGT